MVLPKMMTTIKHLGW